MLDSDSDSDSEYCCWENIRHHMNNKCSQKDYTITAIRPSDKTYEQWNSIAIDTKKMATQQMKVCVFWLPILLSRDQYSKAVSWALEIGLIGSNDELNVKQLRRIETVEAIIRALEKGSLKKEQVKHIFLISNMLNLRQCLLEVLEDSLQWLERTGEPGIRSRVMDFGHQHTCFTTLRFIFTEFATYIQQMGINLDRTMRALATEPDLHCIEKSDEMKKKGNENFRREQYEDAVTFYSRAIKFHPENHINYGNRALCYIRCKKFLKAAGDGKRATLIKPLWAKGHYRYCEALFSLGEIKMALEANSLARILCVNDQEGMKDLEQQHQKFVSQMPDPKVVQPKKSHNKRLANPSSTRAAESQKAAKNPEPAATTAPQTKVSQNKMDKKPVKNENPAQTGNSTKDSKPLKSELPKKNIKEESSASVKKTPKKKHPSGDELQQPAVQQVQEKVPSKAALCKELKSKVQDAHTALTDLRYRNAEQAFSQALALLETTTPKELGLSRVDELLLLYGRVLALTEIGQTEELTEAQRLLEKIKSLEERTFQCLVFYATGKVFVRENRFAAAQEQFLDSLQMVKVQIMPGKHTWPLTKEVIKETQPDYLKEILQNAIEICKFPPIPDAICRHVTCQGHMKTEIYLTDPDFKGYIQICCCQRCTIEYHMTCWKALKASSFSERNEKEFLHDPCLTSDCSGQICSIKIFGPTGLVKCKFEATIPKPETQKKPKVNQICTSLKKLKSKQEHKLKRKQHKQCFRDSQSIIETFLPKKEEAETHSQQKAWLLYKDRVLLHISQNVELLREEQSIPLSDLVHRLKPWLELDSLKGNQIAERILNWQQEPLESVGQVVELLLERKNRVWARVFVQLLSSCLDINPKLSSWACRLDNAGLNAAKSFIDLYSGHLEELDLTLLLNFGPLQEMIIENLGTRPEHFSSLGLTVTEYLKQASPHNTRLFIWTLEEHRDQYDSCHTILDEYFDLMDGVCRVLKKSEENQTNSPSKSRGRKKKRRDPMPVWQQPRSVTPRDEAEQDYFEDDSLSFLHPADAFSVPDHLREQVAEFEDQYNNGGMRGYYKHVLDNNPDPTKESLYDYFAQILEEHGPLVAEDPLLVGELENFPPVAQVKMQEAGGFEPFLLQSMRFVKIGMCIGLTKHAVSLQSVPHTDSLDTLDNFDNFDDITDDVTFTNHLDDYAPDPVLPSPYIFGSSSHVNMEQTPVPFKLNPLAASWTNLNSPQPDPYFLSNDYNELDLYSAEGHDPSADGVTLLTSEEHLLKKHAAVQTCQESVRSVSVNTEPHEPFEICLGDINKKQKMNRELAEQIQKMTSGSVEVNPKHQEELALLEAEIQTINAHKEVIQIELVMFQQKLEEEVRKDQKEKKANQEQLRALKEEIEELVEKNRSTDRNIQEKKTSYETKLREFLELSNQSATEKMNLEEEISHYKGLLTSTTRRSRKAQLSVVESTRDQGLHGLYRELSVDKALLTKLDGAAHRHPHPELDRIRSSCRANIQELEKKISAAEHQYQEQMEQVQSGRRVSDLLPVNVSSQSEAAAAPFSGAAKKTVPPPTASHSTPPLSQPSAAEAPAAAAAAAAAAAPVQHNRHQAKNLEPSPSNTVFDKAIERLSSMFPDYSRSDLMKYVKELRSSSGGSLGSMALQDMVGGVTQLILDHQERLNAAKLSVMGQRGAAKRSTPPLMAPVWQTLEPPKDRSSNALNAEDPCIICHEDMIPDDMCVLKCRHGFHDECIRAWLKEQSTCPTCRDYALLPDDFPKLPGRRRQAP